MAAATSRRAMIAPVIRSARRRAVLRRSTSRCRLASSFRARRFGPPGVAGAGATVGTVAACFGREPDPVAALVFVRFFDLAMSPLRAHRAPDCLCAQLLGVPGYTNSQALDA